MNGFIATLVFCGSALCSAPEPSVAVYDAHPTPVDAAALAEAVSGRVVGTKDLAGLGADTLLVLPDATAFPAAAVPEVAGFIDRGGHLLTVGTPVFETLLYERDGRWGTLEQTLATIAPEHTLLDWSKVDLAQCTRGTNQSHIPAEHIVAHDALFMNTELVDPIGWDTLIVRPVDPAPADHDLLLLRASGRGQTKSILIEIGEKDGARWMAEAPVTRTQRTIGIPANRFAYWYENPSKGRGGEGDRVRFDNVEYIAVGFAASHQMLSPGKYGFTLSDLSTGKTGDEFSVPELPRIEGLSPSYKLFRSDHATRFDAAPALAEANLPKAGAAVWSPVPRAMHASPERGYFWQPLIKGYDDRGWWVNTPLSMTWLDDGATAAFYGLPVETQTTANLAAVVNGVRHVIAEGPKPAPTPELLPLGDGGECIRVEDGEFRLGGERWFAHAINYWPLYVSGMEPQGYFSHWLSPMYYIPELIDQDLALLEELGVNLVSIQYTRTEEAPQLHDFLERCGRHGIKANIWILGSHPTEPSGDDDLTKRGYLDLLRAADLAGNPHVFAYDLAWEPILGREDARKKHDPLFEAWIREQYGSVDRAEAVWGSPANRRDDGRVTAPSDEQLLNDGPHRVMVAAYRRFADDLISRRYREVIRLARTIDDTHLFGVRSGCGGSGSLWAVTMFPYQLTSGAAHLDFVSPEGYGYGPSNISNAALVTRYALWAGHGKPVFWAEFGQHVWEGGEAAIEKQRELYELFADMVRRSGAQGWAGWWFPGGYRVDERSDYGIIDQGWIPRPSARVLGDTAESLKTAPPPKLAPPMIVEAEHAPQGLARIVLEQGEAFREVYDSGAVSEVRTRGTGTTSQDCPLTGVGGVAYTAPGPVEFVNAEVVVLGREGGNVRVEIINTGEATLLPQDCRLVVQGDEERTVPLPAPLGRFERVELTFPADGSGTARMHADRFGPFGERAAF